MSDLGWAIVSGAVIVLAKLHYMEKLSQARYEMLDEAIRKLHQGMSAPIIYATAQLDKEHDEREFKRAERDAAANGR